MALDLVHSWYNLGCLKQMFCFCDCKVGDDSCGSCSSDETHPNPRTLKAKPLRAAPHLSHDFEAFLPRPKHQRVLSTDLSSKPSSSQSRTTVDSPGSSILSLLADAKQCGRSTTLVFIEFSQQYGNSGAMKYL